LLFVLLGSVGLWAAPTARAGADPAGALLTPADVGPAYSQIADETLGLGQALIRVVAFAREDGGERVGVVNALAVTDPISAPSMVGVLAAHFLIDFDVAPASGPEIGSETRWVIGPREPDAGGTEIVAVVFRVEATVAVVMMVGPQGAVCQEEVRDYALLVASRLGWLGFEADWAR
jgi:hypothetical protein